MIKNFTKHIVFAFSALGAVLPFSVHANDGIQIHSEAEKAAEVVAEPAKEKVPPAPSPVAKKEVVAPAPAPVVAAVKTVTKDPDVSLITDAVLADIRAFLERDIVTMSVLNQNQKYSAITQADIDALDQTWRAETETADQPLISATLSNPLSSYLTRVQAHSLGLYTEIFVMDNKGLNVGQSNISSDYWQGDEAKFQKTFPVGADAVFIDEPELRDDVQAWVVQVNLSVSSEGQAIGAATIEVNLTELQRKTTLSN